MKQHIALPCLAAGLVWLATPTTTLLAHSPSQPAEPIPVSDLGAKAGAQYHGDGLSVAPTSEGARLRCVFQKLAGQVTPEGLWLTSTAEPQTGDKFRVVALSVGRAGALTTLSPQGTVTVADKLARYVRPGLTEEYSVSMDGVRQDFVVAQRPAGDGALRVELAVTGAKAEALVSGARLVLDGSGRKLAYSRLQVVDAEGKALTARMEVMTDTRLAVLVEDAAATYPVRIDPTFSDADWISMGGLPGADSYVFATVVDDSGNLYIGGGFTTVGGVLANHVAKWDGSAWFALGAGIDSTVSALAVSGTNLYVGGVFNTAGGIPAKGLAQWDGNEWSALGTGVTAWVNALAVSGTNLYAGGYYVNVSGAGVGTVARWNGTAWSALGAGVGGYVWALAVSDSGLYVGGEFTTAGGNGNTPTNSATNIAKWNGSVWSALGSGTSPGVNNRVSALVVSGSDLYVGGRFTTAGGNSATNVAKWNGSAWSALGSGVNADVAALAVLDTNLYVGGVFSKAGGSNAFYIAKWNGSAWSALGVGLNQVVSALAVSGSDLYVGGQFTSTSTGTPANHLARWKASEWSAVGAGLNERVYALAVSGSDLYAGGDFTGAGSNNVNRVVKWNGSAWAPLGAGLNDRVSALAVSGSNLYVGGRFTTAGGISANRVAKWNGSAWAPLGSGMNSPVIALAVSGSELYAAGEFSQAGGNTVNYVAKWNGSAWSALGSGLNSHAYALAVSGTDLYVGGYFTSPIGSGGSRVAKWNGSAWSGLGAGLNDTVTALAVSGTDLYAGGSFTTAGGNSAYRVARWNGFAWSSLGLGVNSSVQALAVSGSNVYVGGGFTTVTNTGGVVVPANRVAKWDGSAWSALGSGVSNLVYALAVSGSDLYVGGLFTTAGGKASAYLAKANLAGSPPVFTSIVPNPSGTQALLTFTGEPGASYYLLRSTNLTGWQTNATIIASGVTNSASINLTQPHEFFRLRQLP